jgi:hypothetical protein
MRGGPGRIRTSNQFVMNSALSRSGDCTSRIRTREARKLRTNRQRLGKPPVAGWKDSNPAKPL